MLSQWSYCSMGVVIVMVSCIGSGIDHIIKIHWVVNDAINLISNKEEPSHGLNDVLWARLVGVYLQPYKLPPRSCPQQSLWMRLLTPVLTLQVHPWLWKAYSWLCYPRSVRDGGRRDTLHSGGIWGAKAKRERSSLPPILNPIMKRSHCHKTPLFY